MHFSSLRLTHWASVSSTALVVACSGADFQSVARGSDGGLTLDASRTGAGGSRSEDGGAASGNGGNAGSAVHAGGASNGGGSSGMFGSGGSGTAGDGSGSGGQSPTTGGTSNAGGGLSAGGAPGSGGAVTCSSMTTFYPDTDMDMFGRSTGTVVSCTAPPTGSWTTAGGDCDDDDPTVFPKQPRYFAKPHSTSGGNHSYDYDCSGMEEGDPSQAVAQTCAMAISLGGCTGTGYLSTTRAGTGVNPVCGSTSYSTCKASGLGCAATTTQAEPYRCK